MQTKKITSLQNPLIKELALLRESKKQRQKQNAALIFTWKIVADVGKKRPLKKIFVTEDPQKEPVRALLKKLKYQELFLVSEKVMQKITGLSIEKNPIAAVIELPKKQSLSLPKNKRLLILDNLQDPLNVGSLIRTSYGLGWDGVVCISDAADPFHARAIRASMGCIFLLPLYFPSLKELLHFLKTDKTAVYLADLQGKDIKKLPGKKQPAKIALILSNESRGPKTWSRKISQKVTIALNNELDSLNVAAAGAILMYCFSGSQA